MAGRDAIPDVLLRKDVFVTSDKANLLEKEMRLDAPYYSSAFLKAKSIVEKSHYPVVPLIDLCEDIFRLTRFKRVWTTKDHGYGYMASTDLIYFKQFRERENPDRAFVAKGKHDQKAKIKSALGKRSPTLAKKGEKRFFVEEGWILVTCSGSLGRIVLVTKSLCNTFFSHDLIRIVPKKETLEGYLYAYLNSWVGQTFLKRDKYGGWVKHIEPDQIKSIPVLLLPPNLREEIHKRVMGAYQHREEFSEEEISAVNEADLILSEIEHTPKDLI